MAFDEKVRVRLATALKGKKVVEAKPKPTTQSSKQTAKSRATRAKR